jgi:hypothetical protein
MSWLIFIGLPSLSGGEQSFLNSFSRDMGSRWVLRARELTKRAALQHCKAQGIRGTAIGRPG